MACLGLEQLYSGHVFVHRGHFITLAGGATGRGRETEIGPSDGFHSSVGVAAIPTALLPWRLPGAAVTFPVFRAAESIATLAFRPGGWRPRSFGADGWRPRSFGVDDVDCEDDDEDDEAEGLLSAWHCFGCGRLREGALCRPFTGAVGASGAGQALAATAANAPRNEVRRPPVALTLSATMSDTEKL